MALRGYIETGAYQASDGTRTIVLEWSATQSGPGDNYSDVSWTLRGGGTSSQGINAKNIQAQIHTHATGQLWTSATRLYNGTVIASGTVRVMHDENGNASFYTGISGYIYYYSTSNERTANQTFSLNQINRQFWTDFNAYNPNGVQDFKAAYFNVNWTVGDWWSDLTNEPQPQVYKPYGTYMELHNIRPYYAYYELDRVTGATLVRSGVYGKTITDGSSVDIYMKYRTYTMNYDANGGNDAPGAETFTYADGYKISAMISERTGYNFLGWSTNETATTAMYTPGQSWNNYDDSTITLYAVWVAVYAITFDGNGGLVNDNDSVVQSATKGSTVTNFPTAEKAYHQFVGWNTAQDGSGEYLSSLKVAEDITLYAIYQAESNCYVKRDGKYQRGIAYVRTNGTYCRAVKIRRR